MQDKIELTEKQQLRVGQMVKELQIVEEKITPLMDLQKSIRLGIGGVLGTILEAAGVPEEARYALAADGKSLILSESGD